MLRVLDTWADEDALKATFNETQQVFKSQTCKVQQIACPEDSNHNISDFQIIKRISKSKFHIYLAYSELYECHFAVKVFPYEKGKLNRLYVNEKNPNKLSHPNIIKPFYFEDHRICQKPSGENFEASITMMEYAPNGSFHTLLLKKKYKPSIEIARTYFHQLIFGMEYLHQNKLAHLDIKLDNLVVGEQYELKIIDFDLSHSENSNKKDFHSKGSRYFRAPELIDDTQPNFYACDVYSCGIVLFVLLTGGYVPFQELDQFKKARGVENIVNKYVQKKDDPEKLKTQLQPAELQDFSKFWLDYENILPGSRKLFSKEFKELFEGMVAKDPEKRWTIDQIVKSKWFNQAILTNDELEKVMEKEFRNSKKK